MEHEISQRFPFSRRSVWIGREKTKCPFTLTSYFKRPCKSPPKTEHADLQITAQKITTQRASLGTAPTRLNENITALWRKNMSYLNSQLKTRSGSVKKRKESTDSSRPLLITSLQNAGLNLTVGRAKKNLSKLQALLCEEGAKSIKHKSESLTSKSLSPLRGHNFWISNHKCAIASKVNIEDCTALFSTGRRKPLDPKRVRKSNDVIARLRESQKRKKRAMPGFSQESGANLRAGPVFTPIYPRARTQKITLRKYKKESEMIGEGTEANQFVSERVEGGPLYPIGRVAIVVKTKQGKLLYL